MADEEVKIHVRSEADMRGVVDAKAKILELREEAARLRQSAEVYSQKGGFEDPRARTARSEAAAREREANRMERPINEAAKTATDAAKASEKTAARESAEEKKKFFAEDKAAQKAERDEKAKAIREERATMQAAAREAAEEKKKFAAEDKGEKTASAAAQREQQKATTTAEREQRKTASAEKKQEHEEETRRQRFGRVGVQLGMQAVQGGSLAGGLSSLASGIGPAGLAGAVAVGAVAVGKIVQEVWTDYTERQGIALRSQATQKLNERGLTITAARGTSGQSLGEQYATEDRMAVRAADRAELERKSKSHFWNPSWWLGRDNTFEGQRNLDDDSVAQKNDAKLREQQKEMTEKKFHEGEGAIELEHARHRAERTQSGQRAAFIDEQKLAWIARYRAMRGKGGSHEEASETAGLESETAMRDRQIKAGSGLVDARSGAGDIAAAARWGGASTPGMLESKAALDVLQRIEKANYDALEQNGRKDQSVK